MKAEQSLAAIYLVLGAATGFASNYLMKNFGSFLLAMILPLAVYAVSLIPLFRTVKLKKRNWLIQNSLITFFLVWFIIWVFIYNM